MDFNAMINKLLKSASESRRRQLCKFAFPLSALEPSLEAAMLTNLPHLADIRTYAVMPLNEECGLLEWVVNTHALKNILEKGYQRHGKRIWVGLI